MADELSGARAMAHVRYLAEEIGVRLAGTPAERRAADYIAGHLTQFGLEDVHLESFPCLSWGYERAAVTVEGTDIPCLPVAHTPSTPPGGVEAELVYLERGTDLDLARTPLEGRIGLLWGLFGDEPSRYRRLVSSGLTALLVVDDRLPFEWPVAVGIQPYWLRSGMVPMLSLPYRAAWELVRTGARRAHVDVQAWRRPTESQNVVGVVRGTGGTEEEVVLTCHHDSVIAGLGAEDNGSGVACVLELARALAASRPRRTLRFLSCGTEEQLSEGSKHYVLGHRDDMGHVALVVNTDSVGCWAGENEVLVAGGPELRHWVEEGLRAVGFSASIREEVSPFSDHFPFTAAGAPGLWFHRRNCSGGRFYHHAALDTPETLSPGVLEDTLRAEARLLEEAANAPELPFPRVIPTVQRDAIARFAQVQYGLTPDFRPGP